MSLVLLQYGVLFYCSVKGFHRVPSFVGVFLQPRIMLADDHRLIAEACASFLEPEFKVVSVVADGRALLSMAPKCHPDVIIVDIGMPRLNGFDAARELRRSMPEVKLIFLTMNDDPALIKQALGIGASG